jgi:enoyl-CoA hydratase
MSGELSLAIDGAIARIRLERVAKLNAFTRAMLAALDSACATLESNRDVRVVIVESASPKAFCAGADIDEWSRLGPRGMWGDWIRMGHRVFERLARLPQPTIASIGGLALGGGLELALACDVRLASSGARFGLPETRIGVIPGWAGSQRLARLVGVGRAKQLMFSGQPIDAATAAAWGLANEVAADLPQRTIELARTIAENAPIAVQAAKQLADASVGDATALALESFASGFTSSTGDLQEGLAAFHERRPPRFGGK